MHWIDYLIFVVYMLAMLGVGLYFFNKNKTAEDFYVSGRNMSSWHIGLSVVATDVGGGFLLVLVVLVLPWGYPGPGCFYRTSRCLVECRFLNSKSKSPWS
jgi:SSS family solute:Na+ symporter